MPRAHVLSFDLADHTKLPADEGATVVVSAPPGPGSPDQEGSFAAALPESARLLYISTTGVYAPGHGAEVADDHPVAPRSARGQARLDAERAITAAHANTVVVRVPGIYGPGRGVHHRMLAGNYRLIGSADTLVGRIHVDDLVSALLLLGDSDKLADQFYIIGDDCPTSGRTHAMGVAERLQMPEPPTVDPSSVSPEIRAMLSADRKIVPRRLRALSWRPAYPSWREGLEQALAEEALMAV